MIVYSHAPSLRSRQYFSLLHLNRSLIISLTYAARLPVKEDGSCIFPYLTIYSRTAFSIFLASFLFYKIMILKI